RRGDRNGARKADRQDRPARSRRGRDPGPSAREGPRRAHPARFREAPEGLLEDAPPGGSDWGRAESPSRGTRERPVKFWDASAVIPLCVKESPSPLVRKMVVEDVAIVVWWTTPVECCSAFARRRRDNILTRAQEDQARHTVLRLAAEWTEVQPSHQVRSEEH